MASFDVPDPNQEPSMHSIIIPHRDRNAYLEQCLWSIERSARECGVEDYEVVVVDNRSRLTPVQGIPGHGLTVYFHDPAVPIDPFNKPRLQNIGIERSAGEILTFLDADAIVPTRWFDCAAMLLRLGSHAVTKLCYRVRSLPPEALRGLQDASAIGDRLVLVDEWFDNYDAYPNPFEAYGKPHVNFDGKPEPSRWKISQCQEWLDDHGYKHPESGDVNDWRAAVRDAPEKPGTPVFGNSQFSITRKCLGDLRFNEAYKGRGYEDLWLNRELWRRDKENYRAEIVTAPDYALLHLTQPDGGTEEWGAGKYNEASYRRYFASE